MTSRCVLSLALVFTWVSATHAAAPKVKRTGAITIAGISEGLRQAVESKGYRVTLEDGWTAEFWFAKNLKTAKKETPGALHPELTDGEFVGVANFPQGMSDFRGQHLPAGAYTLRYQLLPQDGYHMGVAPHPDFLLASPVASDSRPEQSYVLKKLVVLSAKSTNTGHPAAIALDNEGDQVIGVKDEHGAVVFNVTIPSAAGASERLGIVLKGTAPH